jgi:hypothetical protein
MRFMSYTKCLGILVVLGMLIGILNLVACAPKLVCNSPYILVGTTCCLDANSNNICDRDEIPISATPTVTPSPTPTSTPVPTEEPIPKVVLDAVGAAKSIGNLVVVNKNSSAIQIRFTLKDNSGKYVVQDGTLNVVLKDIDGTVVYSKSLPVSYRNFLQFFGSDGLSYLGVNYNIPVADITKSRSSDGQIFAKFSTASSQFDEIHTNIIVLPVYTDEELTADNDNVFFRTALGVNERIEKGDLAITLVRMGPFTPRVHVGKAATYFRLDLKIESSANKTVTFYPSGLMIYDSQGNLYERKYGGSLDTAKNISVHGTLEGNYRFESIPSYASLSKFTLYHGLDSTNHPYVYEFVISHP